MGLKKAYFKLKQAVTLIAQDEITLYSAQASYYIIISAFPFIMLTMSLVGFILPNSQETVIEWLGAIVPKAIHNTVIILADELFEKSVPIISVTALTALWSASRGIAAVERGVKRVYKTADNFNFFIDTAMSVMYTIMFMIILFATLLLQVFGNILTQLIQKHIHITLADTVLIKGVLFFSVMCLVFQLMYYLFDRRQSRFNQHLPGAAFCSAGWIVFSNLYSLYIDNFSNYSYIYGSLTAVVLLMLWLFCCVIIILLGAELNSFIYKRKKVLQ